MGQSKYLTSMGTLRRKDNTLQYCRADKKDMHLPINDIKEIYCLAEINLNTKALEFMGRHNIIVHFFNYYGSYVGSFCPKDRYLSGKLLIQQVRAFDIKRLKIAKSIVTGIGKNIYHTLAHYQKHGNTSVAETMKFANKELPKLLENCTSIPEIMQVEGELWFKFYGTFNSFLNEDFVMNKRVKRPPDNPINALISFGNSLLYTKVTTIIYNTHLDQRISFLHAPTERRYSLSLDLAEVFKPIVVFKTIFELINRKQLKVTEHFEKKVNYCLLNEKGREIFITAFEKRLGETFEHSKLNRKVSYYTAIKLDCYKLIKEITENRDFVPFNQKEKQ
ncbi:MAG: subtype I-B CRISPR-associated endonuclease Cas1 [Epulopiscium sp. Nele67-Bin004]|nr:MAG: subtype I-B CRISPR-associated endonuclease Cas1 [Epulopiscium sp. Nele67-Bin004]